MAAIEIMTVEEPTNSVDRRSDGAVMRDVEILEAREHPSLALSRGGPRFTLFPCAVELLADGRLELDLQLIRLRSFTLWESILASKTNVTEAFISKIKRSPTSSEL